VGEEINLAVGGHWNEEVIGTNAIGTAIATCAPVQIYASEHFCLDVKRWTCAAAPVLDPVSRCLLGTRPFYRHKKWVEAALWKMESLKAGNHIVGPAIIESDATTFVVPDGFETTIDKHRLFHLKEVK
jgi:N-methylhydantoinase A/oxoprolinase/acetone carboxylase beta subunit